MTDSNENATPESKNILNFCFAEGETSRQMLRLEWPFEQVPKSDIIQRLESIGVIPKSNKRCHCHVYVFAQSEQSLVSSVVTSSADKNGIDSCYLEL